MSAGAGSPRDGNTGDVTRGGTTPVASASPDADAGAFAARFRGALRARAAAAPRTLCFPEADDPRTHAALHALLRDGTVRPVAVHAGARPTGLPDAVPHRDPRTDPARAAVEAHLLARRGAKGLDADGAARLADDPLVFADALVALGEADGCVAGAARTTADVLRAALWTIGTAPGVRTVSSSFYMLVPPFRDAAGEVLTFTDCAVVPEPTAAQLADIAAAAADDRVRLVGDRPVVAFLSYATRGSAGGASVERVREALARFRTLRPGVPADGELQADAALVAAVGARKAPGSTVAGRANVLVFPSLDAGNIAYKLVQRLAGAAAIGPVLQGLARPASDLSRGATAGDIADTAVITALQAGAAAPATATDASPNGSPA